MTKVCRPVDVDEELLSEVMHRYVIDTEAEAVDFALRRLLPLKLSSEEAMALERAQPIGTDEVEPDADGLIDPDPFTIGLGIFSAMAGGGAFLETRRQREYVQQQGRDAFRGAWFAARRTLIHFKGQVDEFETYMLEDGYGRKSFRIGAVRLEVDRTRHKALRRLRGQVLVTASHMGDDIDDLSEFLGAEYQSEVDAIINRLGEMELPDKYRDLIMLARESFALYNDLLESVAEREGFESERR
jgi:Arc/MetJ family transcription regulator